MKRINHLKTLALVVMLGFVNTLMGQTNQTPTYSPIFSDTDIPFSITIEQADFSLPNGIHSGVSAIYKGKWVFLAGRTNGLHGFDEGIDNFPPQQQNQVVYVVDPKRKTVRSRSLTDPASGLTPQQIDQLSVTSPQFYQDGKTVYMTGGYGVDSSTGLFSTKDTLTAIDIPALIHWVTHPVSGEILSRHIRQISDPFFQVTGGVMVKGESNLTLLIFGQNFQGFYVPQSDGDYIQQVRRFIINDRKGNLSATIVDSIPEVPDPNYRRRDLNICPTIRLKHGRTIEAFTAFSGVFTEDVGVWTVPVEITKEGFAFMQDPSSPSAFKQGLNNYISATVELFSRKNNKMYTSILGGLSYQYYLDGVFSVNPEIPFVNQIVTIKRNKKGLYSQHFMSTQYPIIFSTQSNAGNQLLFGASAYYMPASHLPTYDNGVIKLDSLGHKPRTVGYIVGGIQSTLPDTEVITDSSASPYIFKVTIAPVRK